MSLLKWISNINPFKGKSSYTKKSTAGRESIHKEKRGLEGFLRKPRKGERYHRYITGDPSLRMHIQVMPKTNSRHK